MVIGNLWVTYSTVNCMYPFLMIMSTNCINGCAQLLIVVEVISGYTWLSVVVYYGYNWLYMVMPSLCTL